MNRGEAYNILNLEEGASEDAIKKSFRKLAAKNHPDQNKDDPEAENKFKKVNEAYQILIGKQKAEDDHNNFEDFSGGFGNDFGFSSGGFGNINDFISDFFGGGGRSNSYKNVVPIKINLPLTFEESVFGVNKSFSFFISIHCEKCDGAGRDISSKNKCTKCNGQGSIKHVNKVRTFSKTIIITCDKCNGFGYIGNECNTCKGNGVIKKKKSVSLKIPPLGSFNKQFLIKGQGNEYKNLKGNVFVNVMPEIKGNGKYQGMMIDGRNVISDINISIDKLLFGGKVVADTIHGKKEVDIKKMTRPNETITIYKQGVSGGKDNFKKDFPKGNHILIVNVQYPKEDKLTEELKNELKKVYSEN